jgi:hypothetical protein
LRADQEFVQHLLNKIPVYQGGKGGTLTDPIATPPGISKGLYEAILEFQKAHASDGLYADGHVDPGERTITLMMKIAGSVARPLPPLPSPGPTPTPLPVCGASSAVWSDTLATSPISRSVHGGVEGVLVFKNRLPGSVSLDIEIAGRPKTTVLLSGFGIRAETFLAPVGSVAPLWWHIRIRASAVGMPMPIVRIWVDVTFKTNWKPGDPPCRMP